MNGENCTSVKNTQRISIAMAVFNGENYIREQLESIAGQTLPPAEIVICDDSNDDLTYQAIIAFDRRQPGLVHYHRNPVQLGVNKNFEKAISLCTGDMIFLSDQDDVWLPQKVELMTKRSERSGGVFCDSSITGSDLRPLNLNHWKNRGFSQGQVSKLTELSPRRRLTTFLRRVPAAAHDMAFHADLKELLLPFPDLNACHDNWIGVILAATDAWKICDKELTLFRQHESNVSKSGARLTWRRRIIEAKSSIVNDTFSWNETLFHAAMERLAGKVPDWVMACLEQRRDYAAARARMNCSLRKRLPLIGGELLNGNYFRFGRGCQSIVQDLLLR
mgnify:CR=1 FL=1